ncbi:hypothetical protein D3C81_1009850 [compost metagenome]
MAIGNTLEMVVKISFCLPLVNHHFMDLYYQMVVVVIRPGHILFSPQIKTLLQLLKMHLQD